MTVRACYQGLEFIYEPGKGWTFDGKIVMQAYIRGHRFEVDEHGCFFMDGTPWDERRPCTRCGRAPTAEGHDACLGHLSGVRSACCGHGVEWGFILYNDGHYENEEGS